MDLNQIISREVYHFLGENKIDEDYPSSFDMDHFKSLTSFAARKRYADQQLPKVGSGSGRHVYVIDNDYVLKLAANRKGLEQNRNEISLGQDNYFSSVVAKVVDFHQDDLWMESERAKKIGKSRFKQLTGFDFDEYGRFLMNFSSSNSGGGEAYRIDQDTIDAMWEDEFVSDVAEMMSSYDHPADDLARISSYGEVNRNGSPEIVLIDYGLTKSTYKDYYNKKPARAYEGKIVTENPQQMDKKYTSTGLFTDKDRENVLSITSGDNYTKTIADVYAWMFQIKPYDRGLERSDESEFNEHHKIELHKIHNGLTSYNKNVFPITDFEPANASNQHPLEVYAALRRRYEILKFFRQIPAIYLRNLKNEIRKPTDIRHYEYLLTDEISKMRVFLKNLNRLSGNKKSTILNKVFSSKNDTFEKVVDHIEHTDVLFLSHEEGEKEVRSRVESLRGEAEILYDEGDIMVVDVKSSDAMKWLGCGSQWCFSTEGGKENWHQYALSDHVNLVYNFNEEIDGRKRMIIILPFGDVYDMYNDLMEDGQKYLQSLGVDKHINVSNAPEYTNEGDSNMGDELDNFVNPDEIKDGGYAGGLIQTPDTHLVGDDLVNEKMETYKDISDRTLRISISFIENLKDIIKPTGNEISVLLKNYLINRHNFDKAVKIANNDIVYYNNLMKIKDYLKRFGLIKEDLVYWHVDDASPESDSYGLMSEEFLPEVGDVTGLKKEIADKIAAHAAKELKLSNPKYIGEGVFGYAYDVGNSVVKVTTDQSEAVENLKIKGKKNNYIADIYGVYETNIKRDNTDRNKYYYVIVLEKLDTSKQPQMEKLYNSLDAIFKEEFGEKSGLVNIVYDEYIHNRYLWDKETGEYITQILKNHSEELKFLNGLLNIADEIKKYGITSSDYYNVTNLGYKRNGNLGFFDVGFGHFYFGDQKPEKMKVGEDGSSLYNTKNGVVAPQQLDMELQESKEKKIEDKDKTGTLMVGFNIPNWKVLLNKIKPNDIYLPNDQTYGLETDPHVTVLYPFTEAVQPEDVQVAITGTSLPIKIQVKGISVFNNPDFDVVKLDIESPQLEELRRLVEGLPNNITFKDYKPHMTIAYVLRGRGNKYVHKFKKPLVFESTEVIFSDADRNQYSIDISPQVVELNESIIAIKNNDMFNKKTINDAYNLVKSILIERDIKFMPDSDIVTVNKNCRIGGKSDGTSDACNQGEMKNLTLRKIDDEEVVNSKRPYYLRDKEPVQVNKKYKQNGKR